MPGEKPRNKRTDDEYDAGRSWDRFEELTDKLLNVPKEEVDEQRRKWEQEREREKRAG